MAGSLFGLGAGTPSRFPYADRPQPSPGIAPSQGQVTRARIVIISGPHGAITGLFVYAAGTTPGPGNPPELSITEAATDPFGNTVLPGTVNYFNFGGTWYATQTWNAAVIWQTAPTANGPWTQVGEENFHTFVIPGTNTRILYVTPGLTTPFLSVNEAEVWYPPSGDTTGATDTAVINGLLSPGGCAVHLLPGTYYINAPISVPTGGVLRGAGGGVYDNVVTVISATAGFAGSAMIKFPEPSQNQEITDLCLDGSAMPAGTANGIGGITTSHAVLSVKLENLAISGNGIINGIGDINAGTTWRGKRIFVDGVNATAFNIRNAPDSTWTDCASLGAGNHGWQPFGAANATFIGCRAEFSAGDGFHLSGAWGTGNGSGMVQFIGCSTDRNTGNGVNIDATGTACVTFTGLMTRRDGNGTGNSAVAIAAGANVVPVQVSDWQCFPGVNDNGSGTLTPQFGLNVAGALQYLGISGAFIHAATTATAGMTVPNNVSWRNVATRTGTTAAPTAVAFVADSA